MFFEKNIEMWKVNGHDNKYGDKHNLIGWGKLGNNMY